MQMIVRFFATTARKRILGCFQLHNYTGETLCERVVDVSRHSISFFEHRSSLMLLGKLVELYGKHDLMGKRLGQFNLLGPIGYSVGMSNSDKTSDLPTYQERDPQKSLCSFPLQILLPLAVTPRTSVNVFAKDGARRKKQLLDG